MNTVNTALSSLILLSAFVLMACKRIRSYIETLRLQAVLIALATLVVGIRNIAEKSSYDLVVVSLILIVVKVFVIPNLLHKTWSNVEHKVEKDFLFNIPLLLLCCCGLVVLTYCVLPDLSPLMSGGSTLVLVNSVSLVLIGLFFIISRKKAIGQIVGLLVIENGLFCAALFTTDGMPFIVDMGIIVDLLTSVLILGLLVYRINDQFDSIDIDKLNKLKG